MAAKSSLTSRVTCFPIGKIGGIRSYTCYEQGSKCRGTKELTIKKCAEHVFNDVQGMRINGIIQDPYETYKVDKTCVVQKLGANKVVNCTIKK
jgi:hypothetical protein